MKKRLIIDAQILQTEAWHRGMGKYTMQLILGVIDNLPENFDVSMVLNKSIECDASRYEVINYFCPNVEKLYLELPTPRNKESKSQYQSALSKYINTAFYDSENYFLITSLFTFDFFAEYPKDCKKLLLFYDLTPLLFWKELGGYFPPDEYMGRFSQILEADKIFSISETTRQDLIKTFALKEEKVQNINGGFSKIANTAAKPQLFKAPSKYFLFPTGALPHKNNEFAIDTYIDFVKDNPNAPSLLITSSFSEEYIDKVEKQSNKIKFTGNVSDEELEWLYENAEAVIFASKYEGLGIPVLDAVANNKPVIASKIPVFEEMSKRAFCYFEIDKPESLKSCFKQIYSGSFKIDAKEYSKIMDKYTWGNTSKCFIDSTLSTEGKTYSIKKPKPKIAIASMQPGISSDLGYLLEEIYCLSIDNFEVDFFIDMNGVSHKEIPRPTFLQYIGPKVFEISDLNIYTYSDYEAVIYLVDKTAFPSRLAQRACFLPGITFIEKNTESLSGKLQRFSDILESAQINLYRIDGKTNSPEKIVNKIIKTLSAKEFRKNTNAKIKKTITAGKIQQLLLK